MSSDHLTGGFGIDKGSLLFVMTFFTGGKLPCPSCRAFQSRLKVQVFFIRCFVSTGSPGRSSPPSISVKSKPRLSYCSKDGRKEQESRPEINLPSSPCSGTRETCC